MTAKYILAKYVPDLNRMEPRNIGLFVWYKGKVRSKFLTQREARFVSDSNTYKRWVNYWNRLIGKQALELPGREIVSVTSEGYLSELINAQKGNYLLVDGGFVNEEITVQELPDVTEYLFSELVSKPGLDRDKSKGFNNRCRDLLNKSVLSESIHERFVVECSVYGINRHFRFHYGSGNGKPSSLFERVKLNEESSVNNATLMLHSVIEENILPKNRCAVLFESPLEEASEYESENKNLLSELFTAIDIRDEEQALFYINQIGS